MDGESECNIRSSELSKLHSTKFSPVKMASVARANALTVETVETVDTVETVGTVGTVDS